MAAAVADAEIGADQVGFPILQNGHRPDGVDGVRINGGHIRVLQKQLLQLIIAAHPQKMVKASLFAGKIFQIQLLNTLAASPIYRLCHKNGVLFQKGKNFFPVFFLHRHKIPTDILGKPLVKIQLADKHPRIGRIVVLLYKGIISATGQTGVPLGIIHVVHFKKIVIHIACPVFYGAILHIPEDKDPGFSGFLMDRIDLFQHCAVVHMKQALKHIFQVCHITPPLRFSVLRPGGA